MACLIHVNSPTNIFLIKTQLKNKQITALKGNSIYKAINLKAYTSHSHTNQIE